MYKTVQGDTWDIISKKVYQTENLMSQLMSANPELADIVIFPAGKEIQTPALIFSDNALNNLPPWKKRKT